MKCPAVTHHCPGAVRRGEGRRFGGKCGPVCPSAVQGQGVCRINFWKPQISASEENWLWFASLCLSAQADGAGWGQAAFWGLNGCDTPTLRMRAESGGFDWSNKCPGGRRCPNSLLNPQHRVTNLPPNGKNKLLHTLQASANT